MTCLYQGADYVEFDVHLSKDLVPVVYHDFNVVLTLRQVRLQSLKYLCLVHFVSLIGVKVTAFGWEIPLFERHAAFPLFSISSFFPYFT